MQENSRYDPRSDGFAFAHRKITKKRYVKWLKPFIFCISDFLFKNTLLS